MQTPRYPNRELAGLAPRLLPNDTSQYPHHHMLSVPCRRSSPRTTGCGCGTRAASTRRDSSRSPAAAQTQSSSRTRWAVIGGELSRDRQYSPLIGQDTVFVTPMEQRVRLELACVAQCVMVASPGELGLVGSWSRDHSAHL